MARGRDRARLFAAISGRGGPGPTTWVTFVPAAIPWSAHVDGAEWAGLRIAGIEPHVSGIAGAGDVNGDGFDDVAVAAGGSGAWVVFGGAGTTTVDVRALGDRGFAITGLEACYAPGGGNGWTGIFSRTTSVLGLGDQNGDGRPDLAVCDREGVRIVFSPAQPAGAVVDVQSGGPGTAALRPRPGRCLADGRHGGRHGRRRAHGPARRGGRGRRTL